MKKSSLKHVWGYIQHGQGLWGLLPSSVAALIITGLGYLAGYSAFVLVAAFVLAFVAVEFILWRAKEKGQRNAYLIGLTILLVLAVVWGAKQQSDARKNAVLSYDGLTVLRGGRDLPDGSGRVTGVNIRIDVGNRQSFPLWYKVERQFAECGSTKSRLDNPGASVTKLLGNHAVYLGNDLLKKHFENGRWHECKAEFIVNYGRSKDKLDRRFTWRANVQFFICPVTGGLCGQPTTTEEEIKNERILEIGD